MPDAVLLKDGELDPHESRVMRKHPIVGDDLCAGLRSLSKVRPIVRHHHERLDGTGYPDGLRNSEVPLLAQVVSVVDVFDALTTDRPYRAARPADVALQILRRRVRERMARPRARRRVRRRRHLTSSLTKGERMAKYGKKAQSKVKRAMHERKRGTLKSGRSGKRVTSRKQAIAIGLSEAREAGAKVPRKRKGGSRKKK